jgi:tetratricopeptide (TPR) repeat protein
VSCAWVLVVLVSIGCATPVRPAPPTAPRAEGRAAGADVGAPTTGPTSAAAEVQLGRGQTLIARGEMAAAAGTLREALRLQPDLDDARAALGLALIGLGDLDAAVGELRAALARRPDAVGTRLALARALVARQEWPAAREELERVLSAQPDRLDARYALGGVRYAQGDVAGAIDAYRGVLAVDPQQLDARFNLALMLRLARREAEATAEFVAAAQAGHASAQYFAGNACAAGLGVERSPSAAIAWWSRAAEQGVGPAQDALAQLRQTALGRGGRITPAQRQAAEQAFGEYRAALWKDFPELTPTADEPLGAVLLREGRVPEGVTMLIREAWALSQPAQRLLETLYEQGVDGRLPPHDARIFAYLEGAAAEGLREPGR